MRVLVVGSGGREHALCWKIAESPRVDKVFCAPGNAGITRVAETVAISASDIPGLAKFAKKEKIDLAVVGPELPLVGGIVDEFKRRDLPVFGPDRRASILEGSKAFTKRFCTKYNILTPNYSIFTDANEAKGYLKGQRYPLVVKADGLAAGKGVIICKSRGDAEAAIDAMLKKREFGDSGNTVIIEEFLEGEEASFIALSDGEHVLPLASSQDHKAIYDGDQGANTGGMGAYSPAPIVTREMGERISNEIILPTVKGMRDEGRRFVGFLYAGIMISNGRPYLLEYNVRGGDPETQPLMVRLKTDIVSLFESALKGTLDRATIEWYDKASICVVMASRGYPGNYEKGNVINGIEDAEALEDVMVFHAGTKKDGGKWLTNGGRVLGVTAKGENIKAAIENVYRAVDKISWEGEHHRKDIGKKALKYEVEGQMDLY